jgi:preprotein translocase subunit SecB
MSKIKENTKNKQSEQQINVQMQLRAMSIESFHIINPKDALKKDGIQLLGTSDLALNFDLKSEASVHYDLDIFQVKITVKISTPHNGELYFLAELQTAFDFKIENINQFGNKDQVTIPRSIAFTCNTMSISTTRGILFSKLSGTFLYGAILPMIPQQIK